MIRPQPNRSVSAPLVTSITLAAMLTAGCATPPQTASAPADEAWIEFPAVEWTDGTTLSTSGEFTPQADGSDLSFSGMEVFQPHMTGWSVFGELQPDKLPDIFVEAELDGEDNLTRITFSPVGGDFDPHISSDGQHMVFSSTQHHRTADVYLKSVDGRSVTQLTADPAQDVMPVFSPDGRRIAFASDRSGNWDIWVMSTTGGQPMQVTADGSQELHPSWSPDGSKLVYSRLSMQTGRWELWIAGLDDGGRQFICYGLFPEWSPNPAFSRITFQRARERDSRLFGVWTVDYINGEAMNPTEVAASTNAALVNPTWNLDGSRIVFAAVLEPAGDRQDVLPEVADLWMVKANGMDRVNLTNGRFACLMPTWAGDGKVYFVSNREGVDNIWSIGPTRGLLASATIQFDETTRTADTTPTDMANTPSTAAVPTETAVIGQE
ncbi:MAG: PD40 domain-containing protein [Phycisphaerales bacterium]|nr:PD40 domain-containing protein [Phycisphaerales bacterium]